MAICGKVCKKGSFDETKITPGQIKKIKTLQRHVGVDDDVYEQLVKEYSGGRVTSCTGMDYYEAGKLIDHLEQLAQKLTNNWEKRHSPCNKYDCLAKRDETMATPAQLRMIEAMWRERSFAKDIDKAKMLRWFIQRFGVSDILFLTKLDVRKVKRALDNMPILSAGSSAKRRRQYELRVQKGA
ncbi:MAG: DUF1018 domain-containing protein [Nitrospirae bacterium]|nr:DUF1018 domain-containing protein [Nitrospirota bacterium]